MRRPFIKYGNKMIIPNPLIIISGPTATGKTSTSINLAKQLDTLSLEAEIINFDSLLFYKEISIGTAKPTSKEMSGVQHHLISINSVKNPINANDFLIKSIHLIKELHKKNIIPILVGGSGFYLRALIKGMYNDSEEKHTNLEIKKECKDLYEAKGISPFRDFLQQFDITSFEKLHENDHYRNIRAVEFLKSTGRPISLEKEHKINPYDLSEPQFPDWNIHHIYLDIPKDKHWEIIELRTKSMISNGLIDEVKKLLNSGHNGQEKPLQSIGIKETISFLKGEYKDHNDLIEKIYFATRKLAKSQRTFFKKIIPKSQYNPLIQNEEIIQDLLKFLGVNK